MEALLELLKDHELVISSTSHTYEPKTKTFKSYGLTGFWSNKIVSERVPSISFTYKRDDPSFEKIRKISSDDVKLKISNKKPEKYFCKELKPECEGLINILYLQAAERRNDYLSKLSLLQRDFETKLREFSSTAPYKFRMYSQDCCYDPVLIGCKDVVDLIDFGDIVAPFDTDTQQQMDGCYHNILEYTQGTLTLSFVYFGSQTREKLIGESVNDPDWLSMEEDLKNSPFYDYLCEHMPEIAAKVREVCQ